MDLDGFLAGKEKISKQEVLDYLKGNDLQIKEVTKGIGSTKFQQYALPGGENYRELLFTLTPPPGKISPEEAAEARDRIFADADLGLITTAERNELLDDITGKYGKNPYLSAHWGRGTYLPMFASTIALGGKRRESVAY